MPEGVGSVLLHLSGGGTVASRTVIVPKRLGGPLDIYFQALHLSAGRPVALTEFDASGRPLRTLRLRATPNCRRQVEPIGPMFIPLVHGTTPTDVPFTIQAAIFTYGPNHQSSFSLGAFAESPRGPGRSEQGYEEFDPHRQPPLFETSIDDRCPPGEYAIVYGLLREPGSTVLARTPDGLVPLTVVSIPANLHAGGSLAYGAFSAYPTELVARGANGETLFTEILTSRGQNHTEFCVGDAEG